MPSFHQQVVNNQIIVGARVGLAIPAEHHFNALVDTGATRTMITRTAAVAIGAQPVARDNFVPASGQLTPTDVYALCVGVPVGDGAGNEFVASGTLFVLELPFHPDGWDILLGMDVLTRHHITLYHGEFMMSV